MIAPPLKPLWKYDDVVAALGGRQGVAKITRQPPHAVTAWRNKRGTFPTKYYFVLKVALADVGYWAPLSLFAFFTEATEFSGPRKAA